MQLVTITILREVISDMNQQESQINANSGMDAQVLEQGDICFFYRPKKAAEEVKDIEDVRRFFMVTAVFMNYPYNMKYIDHNAIYRDQKSLIFSIG
jgi:hypothetical protein